jgi:tetratricopeptide (TPR) repeat protein
VERKAGNMEAAIEYARRFINDYPESRMLKDVFHNLAYYQSKAGAKEDAVGTYREMVAKFPEDTGVLNAFALACAKNRFALEEGTKAAMKGVELSGGDPGILDTLAEVYYARGMYGDAIETISEAIAKDPQDNYLKEQLTKFKKAKSESREG